MCHRRAASTFQLTRWHETWCGEDAWYILRHGSDFLWQQWLATVLLVNWPILLLAVRAAVLVVPAFAADEQ